MKSPPGAPIVQLGGTCQISPRSTRAAHYAAHTSRHVLRAPHHCKTKHGPALRNNGGGLRRGIPPLRAPTPGSANSFSKGTPQVAAPQTTFCQYLESVTKLDRAARISKLIVECGTTINSRMFTKIRNLRLNNISNLMCPGLIA